MLSNKKILQVASSFFKTKISIKNSVNDIEGWDSLGHLMLMQEFEDKFKINFTPNEIIQNDSMKKIIRLIRRKTK